MDDSIRQTVIFRTAKAMVLIDPLEDCPNESVNFEDSQEGFGCEYDNCNKYPYREKCTDCWIKYLETLDDKSLDSKYLESSKSLTPDFFIRIAREESMHRQKQSKLDSKQ